MVVVYSCFCTNWDETLLVAPLRRRLSKSAIFVVRKLKVVLSSSKSQDEVIAPQPQQTRLSGTINVPEKKKSDQDTFTDKCSALIFSMLYTIVAAAFLSEIDWSPG